MPKNRMESFGQTIATLTSDYSLDMMWCEPGIVPEPTSLSVAREKFESKLNNDQPHNIVSQDNYLYYLSEKIINNYNRSIITPHKALFQLIGTDLGITEPTTRVVPTQDLSTAYSYALHLLESHETIWMGTGSIDDHSDPNGRQNLNPPLYKNIRTKEDLIDALIRADAFEQGNPNSYLKIFPQDREKPAICSMVVSNNRQEGNIVHLKVRKGEYTTSERKAGDDKPISISLDLSGPVIKIYTNQSTLDTKYWLNVILNSRDLFSKLDSLDLKGSDYINPEFLVFMNGADTKISFFTDCIWGSKGKAKSDTNCPKTSPLLSKLDAAFKNDEVLYIPEKYSLGLKDYSNYQFAVLNTLKSANSKSPDRQTAIFILKTQETIDRLELPFKIPRLDEITLKSLWRISNGYSPSSTINVVAHLQNQLSIAELPNPNIEFYKWPSRFDRYLKSTLPIWLYKISKQTYLNFKKNISQIHIQEVVNNTFRSQQITRSSALDMAQAMVKKNSNKD